MIALALFLAQAAAGSGASPTLRAIGPQALPPGGCAAFLWRTGSQPELVAMAVGEPGRLRLSVDGRTIDLLRTTVRGATTLGLPASGDFVGGAAGERLAATLDLSVAEQSDLTDGARIPAGTLTVQRPGSDAVIVPVAGLVGCTPAKRP